MKRCLISLFLVLLLIPAAWAARAPVNTLAQDPYASALLIEAESGKVLFEANADAKIYPASVLKLMPLNNATQITDEERALLGRWFDAGMP